MPPEWQGKPLVLTMDHIDGDTTNNELTNLCWICPNCDRQLPTYAGRNRSKVFKEFGTTENVGKDKCPICGEWKWSRSQYCLNCRHKVQREHVPSRETLKSKIRETSFLQIGKEYGVSDNGVRKWCREYGLPSKSKDIKAISDKDWENI